MFEATNNRDESCPPPPSQPVRPAAAVAAAAPEFSEIQPTAWEANDMPSRMPPITVEIFH